MLKIKVTGIICDLLECRLITTGHLIVMLRFVESRVSIRYFDEQWPGEKKDLK
jgi:hypothetical protein